MVFFLPSFFHVSSFFITYFLFLIERIGLALKHLEEEKNISDKHYVDIRLMAASVLDPKERKEEYKTLKEKGF